MKKQYILASINIYTLIFLSIIHILSLFIIDTIPNNLKITTIIVLLTSIVISLITFLNKSIKVYNVSVFFTFLLNIILIYTIYDTNQNYDFINNIITDKYRYITYNVYVQKKNTTYSNIEKLENKKIGLLKNNNENVCSIINNKTNVECIIYNNIDEIDYALANGEIQSFAIKKDNQKYKDSELSKRTRVIYKTKIKDTI